ncbi:MAG TPA: hypothetical protein VM096_12440 [Vicinamibacterales bacterium]|nr:hypothetical protein [Vicinamibacterales bacterium]
MRFHFLVLAFCDRFLAQRTFELIVAPALADLEFEEAGGRRSRLAMRAAVLRAVMGAWRHDLVRGSDTFLRLTLLSACYYMFPVAVSVRLFRTWSEFFVAVMVVFAMSLTPVLVCFWPARRVRPTE